MRDDDDTPQLFSPCSLCNGPIDLLGVLGNRAHGVCRNCGMHFNKPLTEDERVMVNALTAEEGE